jgi:negative regulator of flagellin synthesis FlgM
MPVNTERVEAIKQAIREGKYKVNPEAIADRLIATARELVEKQRV